MNLRKFLFVVAGIIVSTVFFSCGSIPRAKPLNKGEITAPVQIYSAVLLTGADVFTDKTNKELFQTYFKNNIGTIKQYMLENYQITLDERVFINGISAIDNIQIQDIAVGSMKLKKYSWDDKAKEVFYAEFILTGVVLEDGSMPFEIRIRKDDPEYEPGYEMKINLSIKPVN